MRRRDSQAGQATVEFVGVLPLVAVVGLLLWQAVVAGQAASLAGSAARSAGARRRARGGSAARWAARAAALGRSPGSAARSVLPPRLHDGLRVLRRSDGSVRVTVRVPWVLGGGSVGAVSSDARFAPQGDG